MLKKSFKKICRNKMKTCRSDQVLNPKSGRCVSRTGKIGQAIIKEEQKALLKEKGQIKDDSNTKKFRPVTISFEIIVFETNKEGKKETIEAGLPKIYRWVDKNLDKIVASIAEPYIKNKTLKMLKQVNTLEGGGIGKGGPKLTSRNFKKEKGIYNIFIGFESSTDLIYRIYFFAELREDWTPKLWQSQEIFKTVYNDELHKNKRDEHKIFENGEQGISYVLNSLEIEYHKYDSKKNRLPTKKKIHLGNKYH